MYENILKIGPITVKGYGLMIAIGVILALFLGEKLAKKRGQEPDMIYNLTFLCAISGFLGAKILFCIVEFDALIKDPMSVLKSNGFVVYGGIIGGILAAAVYLKRKKCNFWDYFDIVLPSVAVAQGFGRIGCFLAGCCYGRETDSCIGIAFTNSRFAPNHVKLIPTQLISSAGMFLIAAVLLWFLKRQKRPGQTGALYLILYSIGRFGVEFLRNDFRGEIGPFSTSQFISVLILLVGVGLFLRKEKRVVEQEVIAEE